MPLWRKQMAANKSLGVLDKLFIYCDHCFYIK